MAFIRRMLINTESRRDAVNWTLMLTGASITIGYQFVHTSCIDFVKEFAHFYKDGKPIKMDTHLETLTAIALTDAKISRKDKTRVDFFPCFGDEMFHWGTSQYIKGALIGIPYNFTFKDVADIDPSELCVFNQSNVPWDSKAGKSLLDGLVLSDSAKKFAILRGIYLTNNWFPLVATFPPWIALLLGRQISLSLADSPIFKANFPLFVGRFLVHLAVVVVSFCVYAHLRDQVDAYYQLNADKDAITTFPGATSKLSTGQNGEKLDNIKNSEQSTPSTGTSEYYDGAIDYYSKLIQRNKAYRRLLGKEGPKYFTREGDEVWTLHNWIFKPSPIPLTERLNRIQEIIDYHQKDADTKK